MSLDFAAVLIDWPLLLRGVIWTLGLTAISTVLGVGAGVAMAWLKTQAGQFVHGVIQLYVELIRNTPFIVQLFFVFFGLPELGVHLSAELSSVLAMVINLSAYSCEIVRAGLEATPASQIQAAESLGLKPQQVFLNVILPPALYKVWPALVSQIIIVMLGSSVCGQISTEELSYAANLIQSRNFRAFEAFIVAALIYLALSILIRYLLSQMGRRLVFKGMSVHD
jgi:polar amino acid transport system permease protein